jgi:hypothetical protein
MSRSKKKGETTMTLKRNLLLAVLVPVLGLLGVLNPSLAVAQVYSASDSWTVGPGDYILDSGIPDCGGHEFDGIGAAAQAIAAYRAGGIYGSLGSVLTTVARQAQPQIAGFVGQVLDQLFGSNRYANCVPASVVIPANARITSIQYQANDGSGSGVCVIGQDCQVGWSRFDSPQYFSAGDSLIVTSIFRNWSNDRTRSVTMTVYFTY